MTCINLKSFTFYLGKLQDDDKMHAVVFFFSQASDTRSWVSPNVCSKQALNKDCSRTKGALGLIKGCEMEL